MATDYVKPRCPNCGRTNVRFRVSPEFVDTPYLCNLCGFVWKEEKKE